MKSPLILALNISQLDFKWFTICYLSWAVSPSPCIPCSVIHRPAKPNPNPNPYPMCLAMDMCHGYSWSFRAHPCDHVWRTWWTASL